MRRNIIEKLILPLSDLVLGYKVHEQLKLHRSYKLLSEKELKDMQNKKLDAILHHSISTTKAYSKISIPTGNNLDPQDIVKLFPVLTKRKLQGNEEDYISEKFLSSNKVKLESSGSSGFKTTVYLSKKEHSILRAILINWWEWTGFYLGKPILQTGITPDRGLIKGLKDNLSQTVYCDAFAMSEKSALIKLKEIAKFKNPHLGGYASSLFVMAQVAQKNNIQLKFDAVISWGDKMFDHYKKLIESVFNTKVYENYACNEGLMIGQKLDLDYFYIYTPNVYIEILDEENNPLPDGSIGRVVITKLDGYAMPLIRYDTGDLAMMLPIEEYPNKRALNFPLLKKVIGRNTDIIKTPDGKSLVVHSFTGIFEYYSQVQQFRVIQKELDSIEIEVVRGKGFDKSVLKQIENDILTRTESNLKIYWQEVDSIPTTKSGKPQIVKNHLIEQSLSDIP